MPDFEIPISQEEFEKAGSKFILTPAGSKKGDVFFRKIETGTLDWDTPGQSMKLPTTVTEANDKGHEEKLSFGVSAEAIWKGKAIYKAITGKDMPLNKNKKPFIAEGILDGKKATGVWQMVENKTASAVSMPIYPKLVDIYPADYKVEAGLGIG